MIIGILGSIGSGKNTVAEILHNNHNFHQDSFASTLKDMCATLFCWDRAMLEGKTAEHRVMREQTDEWWSDKLGIPNFSPRLALQLMGTDVMRNHFHKDIWVLSLLRRAPKTGLVISDARFPNEVAVIRKAGGIVIRVDRGPKPEWWTTAMDACDGCPIAIDMMDTMYSNVHASEWSWVNTTPDEVIHNDGTLEDLELAVQTLVNKYGF